MNGTLVEADLSRAGPPSVVVVGPTSAPGRTRFEEACRGGGCQVEFHADLRAAARAAASAADVLVLAGEELTDAALRNFSAVRAICHIAGRPSENEREVARRHGLELIGGGRGRATADTADFTVSLILVLLRQVLTAARAVHDGSWRANPFDLHDTEPPVSAACIGLVGLGNVGRAVAARLRPFGPRVVYASRTRCNHADEETLGVEYLPLEELLAQSSVVSLHLRSTREEFLASDDFFAKMQRGSYFVSTANGGLVDEPALERALSRGHLRGAALDTFEIEPPGDSCSVHRRSDVVATPHLAGRTTAAADRYYGEAARNVLRFLGRES